MGAKGPDAMRRRPRLRRALKWGGTVTCLLILAVVAVTHLWCITYCGAYDILRDKWGLDVLVYCGSVHVFCTYMTAPVPPNHQPSGGRALYVDRFSLRKVYGDRWQRRLVLWFYADGPRLIWNSYLYRVTVHVPLWPFFLLTFIPTAFLWHRDRRSPPGRCRRCGYDLTGNESGVCPECGVEVADERGGTKRA
jgi:hypothetical protein